MRNFDDFKKKYNILPEIIKNQEIKRNQNLSSNVYKIPLYSFANADYPYCVEDNQFENVFEFNKNIFATVIDDSHIKEIKTGLVFPIVDLLKTNDKFSSSIIMYSSLTEDDFVFAVSKNKFLITQKLDLNELIEYLEDSKNSTEEYVHKDTDKIIIKKPI